MRNDLKILYVEDEHDFRESVLQLLGVYNDVEGAATYEEAESLISKNLYDVVIIDKTLGSMNGVDLIPQVKEENPNAVVIILTGDSDFNSVKKCIVRGADDYVIKSGNIIADLLVRIPVAVSRAAADRQLTNLQQQLKDAFRYELVGTSKANMELRLAIQRQKGQPSNVLVTGESGTGKELVARTLTAIEGDPKRPFEAVNCAAIPATLVESTLFGHKKGSFTGADRDQAGKFELAHGGDLFLDEIGELPLEAQSKLLRVLQEGEFHRVGGEKPIRVSCRVIAATNQDLDELVKKGRFRKDLYWRLNVVRIRTSPLRERTEDLADLVHTFLVRHRGQKLSVVESVISRLKQHDWPGNIRELSNVIERAVISANWRKSTQITLEDISIDAPQISSETSLFNLKELLPETTTQIAPESYQAFMNLAEATYLKRAIVLSNGNASEAASRIGVSRTTMFRKLEELGVPRREYGQKAQGTTSARYENLSNSSSTGIGGGPL